jgi:hypothetical protein
MPDSIVDLVPLAALAGGYIAGYLQLRRAHLRRDDVFVWANRVIGAMREVWILCAENIPQIDERAREHRFATLALETSCLLEQGRLFFRNSEAGYRPKILDHILVAHLISCDWPHADEVRRRQLERLAERRARAFVSLAQHEVGRSRTASTYTELVGDSISLDGLLDGLSQPDPKGRVLTLRDRVRERLRHLFA